MRGVKGKVTSSRPVSLEEAADTMARFAERDVKAPRDVAVLLRRTAMAFEDLYQFHQELKKTQKKPELETPQREVLKQSEVEDDESAMKRKKKKEKKRKHKVDSFEMKQEVEEGSKKKKKRKHKDESENRERKEKRRKYEH